MHGTTNTYLNVSKFINYIKYINYIPKKDDFRSNSKHFLILYFVFTVTKIFTDVYLVFIAISLQWSFINDNFSRVFSIFTDKR